MIQIEKVEDNTKVTLKGDTNEIYNDFRALINMIYRHQVVADLFVDAWDNIMEVKGIDKNNISNKN